MNPTARLTRSQPEIQNLPGTPAHALEMGFARYGMNDDRAYRETLEPHACAEASVELVPIGRFELPNGDL